MLVHEYAEIIAETAHGAIGQVRKYTGEPYIKHPEAVVHILVSHGIRDEIALAAAWLHDVLEDTKLSAFVIAMHCGADVAEGVKFLTNSTEGNRAQRKARDKERLANAPGWVQSVKVADLIDNTRSIVQHDPDFAKVYMREKAELLGVLTKAEPSLLKEARAILDDYYASKTAQEAL